MDEAVALPPRRRGRPPWTERPAVCDALLEAAEAALEAKTYAQVTVRQVAQAAGVDPAMVNYYFGSKQGLFVALIDHLFTTFAAALRAGEADLNDAAIDPAAVLADAIRHCFYDHRAIFLLLTYELAQRASPIATAYRRELASRAATALQRFLEAGRRAGRFRADADMRYLSLAIMTLANHPLAIAQNLHGSYDIDPASLHDESWFSFLEDGIRRLITP